jgi:hypothetical protein
MKAGHSPARAMLAARVLYADGSLKRELGVISTDEPVVKPPAANPLRHEIELGLLLLVCVLGYVAGQHLAALVFGAFLVFNLVTVVGVQYEAAAFAGNASIAALNYHDSGTGMAPATINDTGLEDPTDNPRVLGTQTNPSAQVYQTVAKLPYGGNISITEWGLFSVPTGGVLWDHRVFNAIVVESGDMIEFTYTCLFSPGGI